MSKKMNYSLIILALGGVKFKFILIQI